MTDTQYKSYEGLGRDMLRICARQKELQAEFLKGINLDPSLLSGMNQQQRNDLDKRYAEWLKGQP